MDDSAEPLRRSRRNVITDDDQILYLLNEVSRGARRAYDARAAKTGFNQTQWRIIGQLLRDPSLTQSEIAKALELESATIGQAVAVLCAQGLLERRRVETDRRAWKLILTRKLDALIPELREAADQLHTVLWRDISTSDKHLLKQLLAKISANLEGSATIADSR
jgi:DNA-binding MarR family transcriptional regulator